MIANLHISPAELENIIRQHIHKVVGVDKIISIKFNCEQEQDDTPFLEEAEVQVSLKENE